MAWISVAFGGCIGAVLRYLITKLVKEKVDRSFPLATLIINAAGCFIFGLMSVSVLKEYIFFSTGVLGGFTTFSTYIYESLQLYTKKKKAQSVLYLLGSVLTGLLFVFIGIIIAT